MHKILLSALLASIAVPAFAADMPLKAPRPAELIINDWSGIYVGGAAGGAWGREKLSNDLTTFDTGANSSLFGTGAPRLFSGPAIIQPAFSMSDCLISNCNASKMNGIMAGGFAGAQKQLGNWVIGIEGSWDWTSMKKSFSASEADVENVTRFVPTTTFSTVPVTVTVPGQTAPVTNGTFVIPDQKLTVNGQDITIPGQTMTIGPQGINVTNTITGLPPGFVIPAGTPIPVIVTSGDLRTTATLISTTPVTVGADGKAVWNAKLGGTLTVEQQSLITKVETAGGTVATKDTVIHVNGQDLTVKGTTVVISGQTAAIAPKDITIPAQAITLGLPSSSSVRAAVTRTADLETKIDQIADIRGKFGLTNVFFGPNVLLYATGGAAIGHFNKSLSISQTTALCTTQTGACVTTGQPSRTDTFSATSGDTRLGWVVGAGFDWKVTPNFVLGALYRHHEFPKGTVSFSEGTNSLGFGTSRASVDSIQGRLSVLFPIQ